MLLPNNIPMLLLNERMFVLISVIVNIITAELDCIKHVDTNPVIILFEVVDVYDDIFFFIVVSDKSVRDLPSRSIEYMNNKVPPINNVKFMLSPLKYIIFFG